MSPVHDDFPLRGPEHQVFGGSPLRSRGVLALIAVVAVALTLWIASLVVGLSPASPGHVPFPVAFHAHVHHTIPA